MWLSQICISQANSTALIRSEVIIQIIFSPMSRQRGKIALKQHSAVEIMIYPRKNKSSVDMITPAIQNTLDRVSTSVYSVVAMKPQ